MTVIQLPLSRNKPLYIYLRGKAAICPEDRHDRSEIKTYIKARQAACARNVATFYWIRRYIFTQ